MEPNKIFTILSIAILSGLTIYEIIHNRIIQNRSQNSEVMAADLNRLNLFKDWAAKNNRTYGSEESLRFLMWNNNYDVIEEHNAKNLSWTLSLNQFADLTAEEFWAIYLGYEMSSNNTNRNDSTANKKTHNVVLDESKAPDSIDLRELNLVSPAKDQGQCSSCWAFATVGALEGLNSNWSGRLATFSEQQLVDCAGEYGNKGCSGGDMNLAYQYVQKYGIQTDKMYPYIGADSTCKRKDHTTMFNIGDYADVPSKNHSQLRAAVALTPVSVAIQASDINIKFYDGGIITADCSSTDLNHGVLVVGYGSENGTDFWIVKNSWGAGWGENGFIRIARGDHNDGAGMCGINVQGSYPRYPYMRHH